MKESSLFWKMFCSPEYAAKPRCSYTVLAALLVLAVVSVLFVEGMFLPQDSIIEQKELEAARSMEKATRFLRDFRLSQGLEIDPVLDPNGTGLIGTDYSDITTTVGSLVAKRTACNPAFAGMLVRMLREAGCKPGDKVAMSLTGSFPSLNIAALSACLALGLEPRIISSVGSSTYGANIPGLSWLEMEKQLYDSGLFPYISSAISYGGVIESGGGIDGKALELADAAVKSHGAPFLEEGDYRDVLRSTLRRKRIFDQGGVPACYINVGGGLTALGWVVESSRLSNGLLREVPAVKNEARGLVFRYAEEGVPVIHLLNVERLAERYALPVDPVPLPDAYTSLEAARHQKRYVLCCFMIALWAALGLFFLIMEAKKTA